MDYNTVFTAYIHDYFETYGKDINIMPQTNWKHIALSLIVGKVILVKFNNDNSICERTVYDYDAFAGLIKLGYKENDKYAMWHEIDNIQILKVF